MADVLPIHLIGQYQEAFVKYAIFESYNYLIWPVINVRILYRIHLYDKL